MWATASRHCRFPSEVGIETARASILARERGREHVVDLFDMLVERVLPTICVRDLAAHRRFRFILEIDISDRPWDKASSTCLLPIACKNIGYKSSSLLTDLGRFCFHGSGVHMTAEYRHRADDCRNLARQMAKPEHWGAFEEMAQTWEILADLLELSRKLHASGVLLKPK